MSLSTAKQLADSLAPLLAALKQPTERPKIINLPKRIRQPHHGTWGRPLLPMTEERKKLLREKNSRNCRKYYQRMKLLKHP